MQDDNIDYLTEGLDVIMHRFVTLKLPYYDLEPKTEVKKPFIVTIIYNDSDYTSYIYNCIMGNSADGVVPVCIQSLIKLRDVEDNTYAGTMSVLYRTTIDNTTVASKWESIAALEGYEDGMIFDNTGTAENFMNQVKALCYKNVKWN